MAASPPPISYLAFITALAAPAAAWAQATPAAGSPDAAAAAATAPDDEIIVTGTRAGGITAAESAAPIKVLGEEAIQRVGQPNLNQVLTQLVPSFTAEAFGGDTANLTLSARLRGLSPNHALVLVNGKRRHGTANLHVCWAGLTRVPYRPTSTSSRPARSGASRCWKTVRRHNMVRTRSPA